MGQNWQSQAVNEVRAGKMKQVCTFWGLKCGSKTRVRLSALLQPQSWSGGSGLSNAVFYLLNMESPFRAGRLFWSLVPHRVLGLTPCRQQPPGLGHGWDFPIGSALFLVTSVSSGSTKPLILPMGMRGESRTLVLEPIVQLFCEGGLSGARPLFSHL